MSTDPKLVAGGDGKGQRHAKGRKEACELSPDSAGRGCAQARMHAGARPWEPGAATKKRAATDGAALPCGLMAAPAALRGFRCG